MVSQLEMLAPHAVVRPHIVDSHGQRYTADMVVLGANGRQAVVRTGWIVRTDEDVVRLVTLWVEE